LLVIQSINLTLEADILARIFKSCFSANDLLNGIYFILSGNSALCSLQYCSKFNPKRMSGKYIELSLGFRNLEASAANLKSWKY